jgi:hypothetical protein
MQRVDNFKSNFFLSKHINMGASFEDLVEYDLLVKMDLKLDLAFER